MVLVQAQRNEFICVGEPIESNLVVKQIKTLVLFFGAINGQCGYFAWVNMSYGR
jgi:hypothetical protein